MNLKKAKRLRRIARIATRDGSLHVSSNPNIAGTEYERHAVRGNVRVALKSPRSLYLKLKDEMP